MSQGVVYLLEVVEVNEQCRTKMAVPPAAGQGLFQAVHQQPPVWQVGQYVVSGLPFDKFRRTSVFGDVAKTPDPSNGLITDFLWLRVTLENPAIVELDLVLADCIGLRVQGAHLRQELIGIFYQFRYVPKHAVVISGGQQIVRKAPHFGEAFIVVGGPAVVVHHQDSVGG